MSDATERFKARKARQAASTQAPVLVVVPLGDLGSPGEVDHELLRRLAVDDVATDLVVAQAEVDELLRQLGEGFTRSRLDSMLDECKKGVVGAIAGPFGLGRVVGKLDKIGGNVDTIHNVRQGVWATEAEKAKFEARGEYDSGNYHGDKDYIVQNRVHSARFKGPEGVQDAYSDRILKKSQGDHKALDHIHSAKTTHDDAGVYLADVSAVKVANREENLTPTGHSVNSSKGAKTPTALADELDQAQASRRAKIQQLEGNSSLSESDQKHLNKLREQDRVDTRKLRDAGERSQKDRDDHLNSAYYESGKFALNVAKTGAIDGAKMGLQQALGEALSEFMLAAIDEFRDWYTSKRREANLLVRLKRIASRVAAKWKTYGKAALAGAFSGFLSNLVTVCINMVVTTQKRLVRMIREGVFSLAKAMKVLVMPPEGLTFGQAAHEATKLAFAGGIIIGGIALEEILLKQLQAIGLGFFADIAVTLIVGALTAIAVALTTYALDRLDLFGAIAIERQAASMAAMEDSILQSTASIESLMAELGA